MQLAVVNDGQAEIVPIRDNEQRKQIQSLVQLARSQTFQTGNLQATLQEITEVAAKTLLVERVGVWLYTADNTAIECSNLYDVRKNIHISGQTLLKASYPNYFQSLEMERSLAVNDAINDKRTQELAASYLKILGITSFLDAPIWLGGRVVGVVCHEHCGEMRQWTVEEENFASSIADFVALAIEASDRHIVQEALSKSEAQFRAIFERSSIGIGIADIKAQIVDINPALSQMLGYSREELYGKYFIDYISPQKGDLELYKQLVAGMCDRIEIEKHFRHKNGQLVWTKLSISMIPGSNGTPEFFLAIIEDITERKQTELKLRASQAAAEAGNRAKNEFLATMSHELRTPLNAIMGLSQLLQQDMVGSLNEKQQEYVSCIYSSGEHLLAIINDILDLSKVESGKEELHLSTVSVLDLCNYALSTVRDQAQEKGLKLISKIDPEAEICRVDIRRCKQMLINLMTNAIKFTPAGQVSLEIKKVPEGITFTVADTGIGIDNSQFHLLFEPFKQLDSQLNRQYEGTGLGLALTRKLARLHGGDVTVESKLGEGSRFTLFIPEPADLITEIDMSDEDSNQLSLSASPLGQKRILIAEPEENIGIFLQDYLQIIGYQVEWINNQEQILATIKIFQPSLLLLDTQFLANHSFRLMPALKQKSQLLNMAVVFMGVQGNDWPELNNLPLEKYDYLVKPIRIMQLESILLRYLGS
ncbi:PAS domain S-box protein [Nostoc sp. FACHB-87]|uniref:hybrid sensor histidine kinase/response regulator n=1 Tax=Nostocaceae TaxID=1162 RepID=UPI001687F842|nr:MULTISPECIES: ATP-binding protein [Nostocaceae]MBD2457250.1 PAS domain S-box protein [Nostoc sp. FACHB-87]MBD2475206.1 PAS domain S-box protein [Anabaena sp. FACHB-83]